MNTLDLIFIICATAVGSIGCMCCFLCICAKYCSNVESVIVERNINPTFQNPMHKSANVVSVEVCNDDPV